MMTANRAVPVALTAVVVLSLVVLAQPTLALDTTVVAPEEVTRHDPIELSVVVTSAPDESVTAENYTVTLTPVGADESVSVVFAPDGTVLEVDPPRGVVGEGDIRINILAREIAVTPTGSDDDLGYGYGPTATSFDIELPSTAFKQGDYTVQASVNTESESGLAPSPEETFSVLVPAGHQPPNNP